MKPIKDGKSWKYQDGRFYFTTRAERRILFTLTIVWLIAGVMAKINIV